MSNELEYVLRRNNELARQVFHVTVATDEISLPKLIERALTGYFNMREEVLTALERGPYKAA